MPYDVAVSTYLLACWLFHAITFEQSENTILKMFPRLRRSRRYLRLDAQLRVEAGLVVPDTHRPSTVTLQFSHKACSKVHQNNITGKKRLTCKKESMVAQTCKRTHSSRYFKPEIYSHAVAKCSNVHRQLNTSRVPSVSPRMDHSWTACRSISAETLEKTALSCNHKVICTDLFCTACCCCGCGFPAVPAWGRPPVPPARPSCS